MEILAKLIRRMSRESQDNPFIGITEMLPAPNQLWLSDAQDNRYTSELRFVAVDCIGWRLRTLVDQRSVPSRRSGRILGDFIQSCAINRIA